MKRHILTFALALFSLPIFGQNNEQFVKILDFVNCGRIKTFTYKMEAECYDTEVILRRWLLKDVNTPAENASLQTFYFTIKGDNAYELSKGGSLWAEFGKKAAAEIDSINQLDATRQAVLLGLSKTDSLHNVVNRLPSLLKKRDNFWKAHKAKNTELQTYQTTYDTARQSYDSGNLLPSEWDAVEVKYINMSEEVHFLKTELDKLSTSISEHRLMVARLKKETGLNQYKSYREGSY